MFIGFISCRKKIVMYKYSMIIVMTITGFVVLTGSVSIFANIYGQTPTTSDLPATVGNESNVDATLSNDSIPSENVTTVTPITPP